MPRTVHRRRGVERARIGWSRGWRGTPSPARLPAAAASRMAKMSDSSRVSMARRGGARRALLLVVGLAVGLVAPTAPRASAADGDLDTTFGGDGIVTTNVEGTINDQGHDVAVDGEGRIVVAGYSGAYP